MRLDRILILTMAFGLILTSSAFGSANFYETFQFYSTPNDTGFTSKYQWINPYSTLYVQPLQTIAVTPNYDSTAVRMQLYGQYLSGYWGYKIKPSLINQSYPFTFEYVVKDGSYLQHNGEVNFYFLILNNQSYANNSGFNNSEGYLITGGFGGYGLYPPINMPAVSWQGYRCLASTGGVQDPTSHALSCAVQLASPKYMNLTNNTGTLYSAWQGSYPVYPQMSRMTFDQDVKIKIVMDNATNIHVFWNPVGLADIERYVFNDTGMFLGNGTLFFGWRASSGYGVAQADFYLDDLRFTNTSNISYAGSQYWIPESFPDYQAYNYTIVDAQSGEYLNYIPLNRHFRIVWTFNTPAGHMSAGTEQICPTTVNGEWLELSNRSGVGYTYVQDPDSITGRCVGRYVELTSGYWTQPSCCVPFTSWCYCENTWGDTNYTINHTQIYKFSPLAFSNAFKIIRDSTQKAYYLSSEMYCTVPANLTFLFQWNNPAPSYCTSQDIARYTGFGVSGSDPYKLNITNIGIDPYTNTSCDETIQNCTNVSKGGQLDFPPECSGDDCIPPTVFPTPPSGAENAGITDSFDQSQVGGIASALMSPAFIGIIICMVLALVGAVYGGQLIGAMGFIGAFFFMTWWGLFPLWVGMGVIVLASFVTVYMVRDIFTGE